MRYFLGTIGVLLLCGFTRIHLNYDKPENVNDEFVNVENTVQDQQFQIINSSTNLNDFKDGQILVFSSGPVSDFSSNTVNGLVWRVNQEIYFVSGSCITVRR